MMLHLGLCFLALLPCTFAVFADEAYQVDFHYSLLGTPQANSTFFHRPVTGSKASLLYTLSERSVLGAVNPKDGQIVWRQVLSDVGPNPGLLRTGDDLDVLLVALGSTVRAWSAADGKLAWEQSYTFGDVVDLQVLPGSADVVVAFGSKSGTVLKIDAQTGEQRWQHEDNNGDELFKVSYSSDKIHLVSVHKVMLKGLKIRVTTLDAKTGAKVTEHALPSDSDVTSLDHIIEVSNNKVASLVAWTDAKRGSVKVNILGSKDVHTLATTASGRVIEKIHLSCSNGGSHFVVNFQTDKDHWAETFDVQVATSSIRKEHVFPALDGPGIWSAHYIDGREYFVRVTDTQIIFDTPNSRIAAYPIQNFKSSGVVGNVSPLHIASEIMYKSDSNHAVRCAILLSSGDWVLVRNGETSWSRPEALASIVKATWADVIDSSDDLAFEASANLFTAFEHRLRRHVREVQSLPVLIRRLPTIIQNIADSFFSKDSHPHKSFGFNKLLIGHLQNGRCVALDMGRRGQVLWNAAAPGPTLATEEVLQELHVSSLAALGAPTSNLVVKEVATLSDGEEPSNAETSYNVENGVLIGARAGSADEAWRFSPYSGFHIHSVTPPYLAGEPVASIGKVLGDRRVLYKYLNPNTVLVITVNDKAKMTAVNLLDAVSGNVLYVAHYGHVDTTRPIAAALSENWLAFSYTADSPDDSVSKGFQLAMVEFYESDLPNDRGKHGSTHNYSMTNGAAPGATPFAFSQVFHVPEEISQMAVTQTAQGITSKQILAGLARTNSIVAIPPYALDPRRIVGKDPTTQQMSEGLTRYTPMIDFDPKWYLNHREEIIGLQKIMTTPAALESTSLVFAYGLDLFGTRVAPSFAFDVLGNSFNKIQLSLTVVALLIGVFFVAPLIQRKQTNLLFEQ